MTTCPMCGGSRLLGLYSAFWAAIDEYGSPTKPFADMLSETEMTLSRLCLNCDHEFESE